MSFIPLSALGSRICILGPSNSGKSTLAGAIGRNRGLPVIHLDRFYHFPDSDWVPRPIEEFRSLHDAAIAGDSWVMDGNYSTCMPQRFQRATGLILLDVSTTLSLWRYLRRTCFEQSRQGGLEGGQDSIKWVMIHHIAVVSPRNRERYAEMFDRTALPKVSLPSSGAIKQCYRQWGLQR